MYALEDNILPDRIFENELLHVNYTKKSITGNLNLYKFTDKDTNQIVLYIPSLEITGYGDTEQEARELLKASMMDLSLYLIGKSIKELQAELRNLGWEQDPFRNKDFSHVSVDVSGQLQGFNILDGKVEKLALTAG